MPWVAVQRQQPKVRAGFRINFLINFDSPVRRDRAGTLEIFTRCQTFLRTAAVGGLPKQICGFATPVRGKHDTFAVRCPKGGGRSVVSLKCKPGQSVAGDIVYPDVVADTYGYLTSIG